MSSPPPAHLRKDTHIDLARKSIPATQHPMDEIELPYCALPECDLESIALSTNWLGYKLDAPLMIAAMTGGTDRADKLNRALVEIAQNNRIAIGLGSQRASLEQKSSQRNLRQIAKHIPLIGNLGAMQIKGADGLKRAQQAVEDIEADALAIHLNPLQEALQPEGETAFSEVLSSIAACVRELPCPVLIKEVGAGLSQQVIRQCAEVGVEYFDIAGRGGTNWARIEAARHHQDVSWLEPFLDIGIDTPEALINAQGISPHLSLVASGGIRHGLDAAKAIFLGADIVGMAGTILRAIEDENRTLNPDAAQKEMDIIKKQLRLSCFLAGKSNISHLKSTF